MRIVTGIGLMALTATGLGLGCSLIIDLKPGTGLCEGVTCAAADACHTAGTCDPATGQCSSPPAPEDTACDDGDACTKADRCQSGTCTGSQVDCAAADACHMAGTCDPKAGCSNPAADGTPCNDADACTKADACEKGTCTGSRLDCSTPDACHMAGTCDPQIGCVYPAANEGMPCAADIACMEGQGTCQGGMCLPPGVTPLPDGTTCDDGNICSTASTCLNGRCNPGGEHLWAHWDLKAAPPSPRFVSTEDVVFDRLTGLSWQRKLDVGKLFTWDEAKARCSAFSTPAFPSGWRAPTRIELASLVDYTRRVPAIDSIAFPNAIVNGTYFWSSSSPSPTYVWIVSFGSGYVGIEAINSTTKYGVRCVR